MDRKSSGWRPVQPWPDGRCSAGDNGRPCLAHQMTRIVTECASWSIRVDIRLRGMLRRRNVLASSKSAMAARCQISSLMQHVSGGTDQGDDP